MTQQKLFSENLGSVKTDEELANLMQQYPSYDPAYVVQSAAITRRQLKEWLETLWSQYESYADVHFLKEFKKQFLQRSWELYLGATLLNRGFDLKHTNGSGPDFDVWDKGTKKRVSWVEAIAVTKGSSVDRVPDVSYNMTAGVPEEQMQIRLAAAINEKYRKYLNDLEKKYITRDDPYIVAINRAGLEHVDGHLPLIFKALFGIGHLALRVPLGEKITDETERVWTARYELGKSNGSKVEMLFFEDPQYACISAVIYCTDSILNSPREPNEMGENFIVIHNPYATNPLPRGVFPFGAEYEARDEYLYEIRKRKDFEKPDPFDC